MLDDLSNEQPIHFVLARKLTRITQFNGTINWAFKSAFYSALWLGFCNTDEMQNIGDVQKSQLLVEICWQNGLLW